jgi:CubicO group peptidase (beta-lactamase class C family)/inorganic pyrophosphatase
VQVFIENEAGSAQKHTYDERTLALLRSETVSRAYPFPYGFVLGTRSGDGDAVDCFVISGGTLASGAIVACEAVALLEQVEDGETDHKILAVPAGAPAVIDDDVLAALTDFISGVFAHVPGKQMRVGRLLGRDAAEAYVRACGSEARLMTGSPPPSDEQVTLANWRTPPFNRWAFQHVRELIPSADVPNDPDRTWSLPRSSVELSNLSFAYSGGTVSFEDFLTRSDTDGLVVLHRGVVVTEIYRHGMTRHTPHILMSVSKSLLGIVAGILAARDVLDPSRPVTDIIPEIGQTAYSGATIRDLLDMRAGIQFDEDYLATSGLIVDYRKSHNWNPLEPGDVPSDLRSYFQRLTQPQGAHGGPFHYVSPNTDLLGWVIERAAGRRYADLVSELLWLPMGASRSAYITVDRLGAPRCAGGVCATVEDLARIGQLIVQGGSRDGSSIIPEQWIDDIVGHGSREAWNAGDFAKYFPQRAMHYRHQWYALHGVPPWLFALGINGQYLFIDRQNQIVIAKVSSQPVPLDEERILLMLAAVEALRRALA